VVAGVAIDAIAMVASTCPVRTAATMFCTVCSGRRVSDFRSKFWVSASRPAM